MNPLFSIITITYNAESTLERTIKSVLSQNYPHIEYIIIDGASTDGTTDIIKKYRNNISKVVSEKDNGIYDAMNKGLLLATGDYIWFMNAGDTIYASDTITLVIDQLREQVRLLPDIIYGETAIVDNNEHFLYPRRLKVPKKLTWRSFSNGMMVCHQAFIAKRDITPAFDLRYRFSADYEWCIRCMKQSNSIYNSNLILANYLNEGVTTRNMKASLKERYAIMCKYYGTIITFLRHIKFAIRFGLSKLTGKV